MRVEFSKEFEKAVRKLSGKMLESVREAVQEVMDAENIEELTDCKKLVDYDFIYRLRIGSYRAFFSFHVQIVDDCVMELHTPLLCTTLNVVSETSTVSIRLPSMVADRIRESVLL